MDFKVYGWFPNELPSRGGEAEAEADDESDDGGDDQNLFVPQQ